MQNLHLCLNEVNDLALELLQVVGTVGSGKSSLVSAMLGELEKRSGRVNVIGKKHAFKK